VDRYIAVSPNAARCAVQRLGIPKPKIRIIPNSLILPWHDQACQCAKAVDRAALCIAPDDYVFLNVAFYNLCKPNRPPLTAPPGLSIAT
jgi:hypothetical protein